jgi:hypothetical protein
MPSYRKSFNFRNGLQVDNDKFVINPNGLVGIGTSVPSGAILDVYGDVKVSESILPSRISATGVTTSQGGFTSGIGVTNPVKITVSGNTLTFTVTGVGSTSLTLY